MTDTPRPTAGGFAVKVLVRVLLSAAVGAVLLLVWVRAHQAGMLDRVVNETTFGEFVMLVVIGLPVALVVSGLLAGPVLWLLGVRPVWPVVLTGPVLLALAHLVGLPGRLTGVGDRWTVLILLAGLSYGLAGLLTVPAMRRRRG
ncbi:hypothetical protein Q5530_25040 [Saccharothrix sp. BKS2]|uniref:hypothetical protein n=1 Tax=Saccharothrix sp. BKS2 TaxID=3064400 RepID=UPI0039EAA13F